MTIHEPATLITDYLLTVVAGGLAWRLRRLTPRENPAARAWVYALGLTAMAAFLGGTFHGFGPEMPVVLARTLWLLALVGIAGCAAALDVGLLREFPPVGAGRVRRILPGLKLAAAVGLLLAQPVFLVAIVTYGLSLVAWALAALLSRRAWTRMMLAAVGLSVIAAVVQQKRWAPAPWFNHNDLYHVLQALALVCFYRAARCLGRSHSQTTATVANSAGAATRSG